MKYKNIFAFILVVSSLSGMQQEKKLPTTFDLFTALSRDLQIQIVIRTWNCVPFLRTSKEKYHQNGEFTGELIMQYLQYEKTHLSTTCYFVLSAAELRTPGAAAAVKIYLEKNPQEKNEVEKIFYCNFGHERRFLKVIAGSGINVNAHWDFDDGNNALLQAAFSHRFATAIPNLLSFGADINSVNDKGDSALMLLIANHGNSAVQTARLLVDKGINVQHKNAAGYTAMRIACMHKDLHIMDLLSDIKKPS